SVRHRRPGGIGEERILRFEQHTRPDDAAATHADSPDDPDMGEDALGEESAQPDPGHPQIATGIAAGNGEIVPGVPSALFEHEDLPALLAQAQCRDGTTESTAHHDDVDGAAVRGTRPALR